MEADGIFSSLESLGWLEVVRWSVRACGLMSLFAFSLLVAVGAFAWFDVSWLEPLA